MVRSTRPEDAPGHEAGLSARFSIPLHPRQPALGAPQAIELRYVFNTFDPATAKKEDRELATKMMKYWVRFAKTGDPNVEGLPTWPEYDGEKPSCLELGAEIREGVGLGDDICDSLDRFTLRAYSTGKDKD